MRAVQLVKCLCRRLSICVVCKRIPSCRLTAIRLRTTQPITQTWFSLMYRTAVNSSVVDSSREFRGYNIGTSIQFGLGCNGQLLRRPRIVWRFQGVSASDRVGSQHATSAIFLRGATVKNGRFEEAGPRATRSIRHSSRAQFGRQCQSAPRNLHFLCYLQVSRLHQIRLLNSFG